MALKKFNRNENGNLKKKIIIGIYAFLIIGIILTGASYAVYQQEAEVTFINARVGNFKQNDIELAMKLNGEEVEVPPSKDNYTVTVDCDNADGSWDSTKWAAVIGNIRANKVKCEVNFVTAKPTLTNITATSTLTSINLSYKAVGIGVSTICKYGTNKNYGSTASSGNNTKCSITGLNANTTYYYQVCTTNTAGEVCKDGNIKTKLGGTEILKVGDYISMTPTATSYTISSSLTGYTSDQTIKPSELNLWRVIKKNDDGTVEMVSEYIANAYVYFQGDTGYKNFVGALNTIVAQYTNEKYVQSTRNVGYKNQTETCTTHLWADCPSDTGYETDINLIKTAIGTLKTTDPRSGQKGYWISARYAANGGYYGRYVSSMGNVYHNTPFYESGGGEQSERSSIRPIVTLKSSVEVDSGDGQSAETAYTFE